MKKTISLLLFANILFASDSSIALGEKVSSHVDKRASNYHLISASSGDTITTILNSKDDNADLYVAVGYRPTANANDCHSTNSGTKADECSITLEQDARVYVRVYGRKATDYDITVTNPQVHGEPITREQLKVMIENGEDVTKVNTSQITDMSHLFEHARTFNQDISNWDVSNVTNMSYMFFPDGDGSQYKFKNHDLRKWNVKKVTNHEFFFDSFLAQTNIEPNWIDKPANCLTKNELRRKIKNHEDVTQVDTSCITDMSFLFAGQRDFNQDISNWDVSNVTNMKRMFWNANSFNQYIGNWDVSKVTDMHSMFENAGSFNQNIRKWNAENVMNFVNMFQGADAMERKNKPIELFDEQIMNPSGYVYKGDSKYYEIPVSSGDTITTELKSLYDGSNADLYVGVGYRPKSNKNDCSSTNPGTQDEKCSVTVDSDTTVYVRIYGRKSTNYFAFITKQ